MGFCVGLAGSVSLVGISRVASLVNGTLQPTGCFDLVVDPVGPERGLVVAVLWPAQVRLGLARTQPVDCCCSIVHPGLPPAFQISGQADDALLDLADVCLGVEPGYLDHEPRHIQQIIVGLNVKARLAR